MCKHPYKGKDLCRMNFFKDTWPSTGFIIYLKNYDSYTIKALLFVNKIFFRCSGRCPARIVWQGGNHLTTAPPCGEKLLHSCSCSMLYSVFVLICIPLDGVLPLSRMLKVPPETKAGYKRGLLSVFEVGSLSQNVNICPDHWRLFNPKCHICILLESQFPRSSLLRYILLPAG